MPLRRGGKWQDSQQPGRTVGRRAGVKSPDPRSGSLGGLGRAIQGRSGVRGGLTDWRQLEFPTYCLNKESNPVPNRLLILGLRNNGSGGGSPEGDRSRTRFATFWRSNWERLGPDFGGRRLNTSDLGLVKLLPTPVPHSSLQRPQLPIEKIDRDSVAEAQRRALWLFERD